jgi:hypothetical protein
MFTPYFNFLSFIALHKPNIFFCVFYFHLFLFLPAVYNTHFAKHVFVVLRRFEFLTAVLLQFQIVCKLKLIYSSSCSGRFEGS